MYVCTRLCVFMSVYVCLHTRVSAREFVCTYVSECLYTCMYCVHIHDMRVYLNELCEHESLSMQSGNLQIPLILFSVS